MKHYKFGGSTAARTIGCPAWTSLSADMPKQIASSYAHVGTMLHDCMEHALLDGRSTQEFLGYQHEGHEVTQDQIDNKLTPAYEAFKELCAEYKLTEYEAETTMEHSDDIGGTADFIARGKDIVCVGDWKFGDGISVSPTNSAQGLFYAMLARTEIPDMFEGCDRLLIAIIQPSNRGEETLKVWKTDMDHLDEFEDKFLGAVKKAKTHSQLVPTAGDHCKWCPAAPTCPAKTGLIIQAQRLNPTQLKTVSEALDVAKELSVWIKEVNAFAHEQMEMGVKFDNWKLVQKRATNKWYDESSAMDIVRKAKKLKIEECVDSKMKSPTQLKKVCKEKGVDFDKFDAYCSATSSGTTIAAASDKRPEYLPTALGEELSKILG